MCQSTLSRELALRIGLAARVLPDTQPKELIHVLIGIVGFPLTEEKLESLTLKHYRQALNRTCAPETLQRSLNLLQGQQANTKNVATSQIQFYREGDMPYSIRVAVASQDGVLIDGHFSDCKQFYIYQVSATEQRLIAIRAAETTEPMKAEQKQHYRAEIIQDCQVLYSQAIGGPAAAKVIKQGVHPIKLSGTAAIADIIEQLQHVLRISPPPWLAKSMGMARKSSAHSIQEDML
jgi:nitrogen fixation protein NifX